MRADKADEFEVLAIMFVLFIGLKPNGTKRKGNLLNLSSDLEYILKV
jgi:hypothetical protein